MFDIRVLLSTFSLSLTLFLVGAGATLYAPPISAADTDIFLNPASTSGSTRPNVLVILDNTANWSQAAGSDKKFDVEKDALKEFFTGLKPDKDPSTGEIQPSKFNVGLMLFAETGSPNNNVDGGYVRYHIREMGENNSKALGNLISNLGINADKGNNASYALAMHEAYLYFEGLDSRSGHEKKKTDSGKPTSITDPSNYNPGDTGVWKNGPADVMKTVSSEYIDPTLGSPCGGNYVVFISNGPPDKGENTTAESLLNSLKGKLGTDPISLNPKGEQANWSDEYARFLNKNGIQTFTIDVLPGSTGLGPDNTMLLKSMANQGEGIYYAVTSSVATSYKEQIKNILTRIFDQIQAVNTIFASSALPISLSVRGTNENQVYLGMFRPEASRKPCWLGNLKLYKLGIPANQDQVDLVDVNNAAIQSPITGFVLPEIVSFWTQASNYWAYNPQGEGKDSDRPDGEIVEKGATAQKQRDAISSTGNLRKIYTKTTGCTDPTLKNCTFNSSHVSQADLGASSTTERDKIIAWVEGIDNREPAERLANQARPSIHGDILHSTPAVVNYGSKIVAFYGSNDGLYRAVEGGLDGTKGKELWAFVPSEFLSRLKRLRDDAPLIKSPDNNPAQTDSTNRDYFFDGGTAVYREGADTTDDTTDDKVWLFLTARRGGRFIYALDVTDPENPTLKWKITSADAGFEKLGQTWSMPQIRVLNLKSGGSYVPTPVLFFGAGYDSTYDDKLPPSGTPTMGTGLFAVKATDGTIVWSKTDMPFPIPSDVSLADKDQDDYPDYLYVGDTSANLWRVALVNENGNTDPASWTVTKLATLGGADDNARKFLFRPAVVRLGQCGELLNGKIGVFIGSGDREHPLAVSRYNEIFDPTHAITDAPAIQNRFYMVVDDGSVSNLTESNLINATAVPTEVNLTLETSGGTPGTPTVGWGWYFNYPTAEEKTVGSALIFFNQAFFGTSEPPSTEIDTETCSGNLGTARIYTVQHCSGQPLSSGVKNPETGEEVPLKSEDRFEVVPGGGLLPSPVAFHVEIDGEQKVGIIMGLNVKEVKNPGESQDNQLIYWYKEMGQ